MTPRRSTSASLKERYAVLLDIGRVLPATRSPEALYRAIYEQTSRVLETTGFYVSLYDPASDTATVVFYADRGKVRRAEVTYRGSESAAIREKQPVLTRLDRPEQAILLLGEDEITRSSVSAPMLREGMVLGVISAQSYRLDAFDKGDLDLLTAVADLAAVALENARFLEETVRRRKEAERLEEISRALTASLDLKHVLERIIAATLDLFDADGANVWLFDEEGAAEVVMTGGASPLRIGEKIAISDDLRQRVVERRESVVFDDLRSDPLLPPDLRGRLPTEAGMAVPLVAEDRVIGALTIGHRESRSYREDDVRLLERLSHGAAIAVENARLLEQIRTLSLTDPLTGLANRRHLESSLEREFAAARRGRRLTIVLFDLDHFKAFNDAAGHQAGDQALRVFGQLLAGETRSMNLAARYGGDEFMSVLSDTDRTGGLRHATRIADAVCADAFLASGGILVSAGVASYNPSMGSAEELIRAADHDLYHRKAERSRHEALLQQHLPEHDGTAVRSPERTP